MMTSRFWPAAFAAALLLLVLDMSYILLAGRTQVQTPAIEDVFKKGKGDFSAEIGTLSNVVPPTDYEAAASETHGPQYRTVDWLKGQGAMYWTLQVMQSGDEEQVKQYLAHRIDREQFAYFLQKVDGQMVYVISYGNYVTRELALGVAEGMDFGLPTGQQARPEKFQVYIDEAPIIQPSVDAPAKPSYGDVPPVPIGDDTADSTSSIDDQPDADSTPPTPPAPAPGVPEEPQPQR